jgi:hypothetical protein
LCLLVQAFGEVAHGLEGLLVARTEYLLPVRVRVRARVRAKLGLG